MPYLVINTEAKLPQRKVLEGPTIVGRSRHCDVSIDDQRLSRQHCRFEPADGENWAVIDLASTNGTSVAGQNIASHRLLDGDEVFVGRTRIVFHARSTPPARPERPTLGEAGESDRVRSVNPSDTLVDSHFPQPRVDRTPTPKPAVTSAPRAPLAFQRPPATPQVPTGLRPPGLLRSIWRRLRGDRR